MEEKNEKLRKILILGISLIIVYWGINNLEFIGNIVNTITGIVFPFILGGAFAFVLNIPMSFWERKLLNLKIKKKKLFKQGKLVRILALIFAVIVISVILYLIINLVVPELINIIQLLIDNIPYYAEEINRFLQDNIENIQEIDNMLSNTNFNTESLKNELTNFISSLVTSSFSIVMGIIGFITNIILAIIFAVYILTGKEKLGEQVKRIVNAYFSEYKANKIFQIASISQKTFKSFFTVQCLEATILGVLCIIGMLILDIPYAAPIGALIGVTALIPIVGAFIGVAVGAILIVSVEPIKVITFIIFFLILQQFEGNVIYPRVVGNSVGLPGMWVLVAVTIGGSLFGILGMLLGVPVFSIIYTILKIDTEKRLKEKLQEKME